MNKAPHGDACLFIEKVYTQIPELCRRCETESCIRGRLRAPLYVVRKVTEEVTGEVETWMSKSQPGKDQGQIQKDDLVQNSEEKTNLVNARLRKRLVGPQLQGVRWLDRKAEGRS